MTRRRYADVRSRFPKRSDVEPERPQAISPDDVEADAVAGRLFWEAIEEEQRRKHWGAL